MKKSKDKVSVFKMNDYDTVISPLSKKVTNEWYKKECMYDDEEQPIDDVIKCNPKDGYWSELNGLDEVNTVKDGEEIHLKRIGNTFFEFITFEKAITDFIEKGYEDPYILCSTEY